MKSKTIRRTKLKKIIIILILPLTFLLFVIKRNIVHNGNINNNTIINLDSSVIGVVVKVIDGDTLIIQTSQNKKIRIRVYAIDAPERSQPYSKEATNNLQRLCSKEATVTIMDIDRYSRIVGIVYCSNVDVGINQIHNGYAWVYSKFILDNDFMLKYTHAQNHAQSQRVGIWKDKDPTPPWEWRNQ